MSNDEFIKLLDKYLTPEDIEILGGREKAAGKLAECCPYLGVFASAPTTLGIKAFEEIIQLDVTEDEANRASKIAIRIGIFQDGSYVAPGRVCVSESMLEKLKQFLIDDESELL